MAFQFTAITALIPTLVMDCLTGSRNDSTNEFSSSLRNITERFLHANNAQTFSDVKTTMKFTVKKDLNN
jgi:hypothetical protein